MDSVETSAGRTPLATLTPSQQNSETSDGDFSKLTPAHFGISADSFLTFPKEKDKSRVAQLKSRRRSTIGVRGSPETNSLIRFRAKEAMKTPPRTPHHLLASPLFTGCDSLKQKMAAFQRLMGEDEENVEQSASLMAREKVGECGVGIGLSEDVQADTEACLEEMDDRNTPSRHRPALTPPASKRRRRVPHGFCEQQIQEEPISGLHNTLTEEVEVGSSEFKSPEPNVGLGSDSQSQLMSFPMLSKPEVIRTDDVAAASVSKKKRVRFGAPLSPEYFDKTLPPSTPLQKGATPLCPPSSTGRKPSLLKTPQRFDPSLPQPDFNSPKNNGASPVLSMPRCGSREVDHDEDFLDCGKISFSLMDEEWDNPLADSKDTALAEDLATLQPPSVDAELINTACQEEEHFPPLSTSDHALAPTAESEPNFKPPRNQQEQQPESPAATSEVPRSRSRKRKQPAENETEPEIRKSSRTAAASGKEKMKQPEETETETRRSSRTAAAAAKGKMKTSTAKRWFGTKEVDRSLYGKRDYASKNPLLSPILEYAASSQTNTPTQPHPAANSGTPTCSIQHGTSERSDATAGLMAAAALWRRRFLPQPDESTSEKIALKQVTPSTGELESEIASTDGHTVAETSRSNSGTKAQRARRNSGRPAGRRRSWNTRVKRVSNNETESGTEEEKDGHVGDVDSVGGGHENGNRTESSSTSVGGETDQEVSGYPETAEHREDSASSAEPDKEPELKTLKRKKQTRRSFRFKSTAVTDQNVTSSLEANQPSEEIGGQSLESEGPGEFSSVQRSEEQNESVLEPWQEADFNIEDILKPVVKTRGSVRRSLRNRRSMDVQASGLAWVDHTSPEMITASHRRTRSRQSAVFQPSTLPDAEETQPSTGE